MTSRICALFFLTGLCVTGCSFHVPKLLNPIGWFRSDPLKKVQETEEKLFLSKLNLVLISQGLLAAARLELYSEDNPTSSNLRAREYLKTAAENLDQALGPVAPEIRRAAEKMVKLRSSGDAEERARGDKMLVDVQERSAKEVAIIVKQRDLLAKLRVKEAEALQRAAAAEAQLDFYKLCVFGGLGCWFFFAHALPRLAALNPATAGIYRLSTGFASIFAHTGKKQP